MDIKEALLSIREIIEKFGDSKTVYSYYIEFGRMLEVLRLVKEHCRQSCSIHITPH
jgi:hypothetical protein